MFLSMTVVESLQPDSIEPDTGLNGAIILMYLENMRVSANHSFGTSEEFFLSSNATR